MPIQPSARWRRLFTAVVCVGTFVCAAACGQAAGPPRGSSVPPVSSNATSGQKASPGHTRQTVAYAGTIAAVTGQQLSLRTAAHRTVSLALAPSTKVLSQTGGHAPTTAQAGSLAAGQRVQVRAVAGKAGLTAVQITILVPQASGKAAGGGRLGPSHAAKTVVLRSAASGGQAGPSSAAKTVVTSNAASGQKTSPGHTRQTVAYAGTIAAVTGQQLSLRTAAHRTISLALAPSTKVLSQTSGHAPTTAQAGSLAAGQRIRVRAVAGKAGLTAVQITVLGAPHGGGTLRGTVTAVGPSSLTLRTVSGQPVSVGLPAGVRVEVAPKGGVVTASTVAAVKIGSHVTMRVTRATRGPVAQLIRVHIG